MTDLQMTCKRNPVYFSGYLFLVILSVFYCFGLHKAESFTIINHLHTRLLDYFFIGFTNLGNGFFIIGIMMFMLIRKKLGWTIQIGISFVLSGLIAQLLKHMLPSPRPRLFFGEEAIHYFYGITCSGNNSFPSGHTATIFALTTLLCLYFRGKNNGILFLLIAFLTGYSRIYLSQHFPIDVFAGSLIGVLTSLMVYQLIPLKYFEKKYPKNEYGPQSITLR
jgi:membrane-associated phospholipid phosphatase